MFRSPSKVETLQFAGIELVKNFNYRIQRNSGKNEDNIVGDCLHSLFYLYNPEDMVNFLDLSWKVIENYGLSGDLTHPDHIYQSATNLYEYLTDTYGKPEIIHKELPLQMVEN